MVARILEQAQSIKRVFANERRPPVTLTWQDEAVLESLNAGLKPVAEFTDILSGEDYVTVSSLLPMLHLLERKVLVASEDDDALTTEIKAGILSKVLSKYDNESIQHLMRTTTFLDPRYRGEHDDKLQETQDRVKEEMTSLWQGSIHVRVEPEEQEDSARPAKRMSLGTLLGKAKYAPSAPLTTEERAAAEITRYLREDVLDGEEDPLMWWKINEQRLPVMAKLARKYLCVCATSTASERVFSTAGNIVTPSRALLKPDKVHMLIFLAQNA